jgi:hypothetical protein
MKQFIPVLLVLISCQKSQTQLPKEADALPNGFEKKPQVIALKGGTINEASGIADSKINPGHLWVEQDGGIGPLIHLVKHDGTIVDSIYIDGATNRDWEDMVLADGKLYIGETGDNNETYDNYKFYRFAEPAAGSKKVTKFDVIKFKYPDGSHDAEAFLVEPRTSDIYIFTKRDEKSKIYKLAYPQSLSSMNEAVYIADLPYSGVVSAAISPDAREIILKTYTTLFYYSGSKSESVSATLAKTPAHLDYQLEMQGEAVVFNVDNKGFYTLSEKAFSITPALNYYKRK